MGDIPILTSSADLQKIYELVSSTMGFDLQVYDQSIIRHQLQKHLREHDIHSMDEFCQVLEKDPDEMKRLLTALTVQFSYFFRDPLVFSYLQKHTLPSMLLRDNPDFHSRLRIWSAGCSAGEETYSVALIVAQLCKDYSCENATAIFGTDINDKALEKARKGRYSAPSVNLVPHGLVKTYFIEEGDEYVLHDEIREAVTFKHHDLLDERHVYPPESIFGDFDLILCRNVAIYLDKKARSILFSHLLQSLSSGGYLVLDQSEKVPHEFSGSFRKVSCDISVFQKKGSVN